MTDEEIKTHNDQVKAEEEIITIALPLVMELVMGDN